MRDKKAHVNQTLQKDQLLAMFMPLIVDNTKAGHQDHLNNFIKVMEDQYKVIAFLIYKIFA